MTIIVEDDKLFNEETEDELDHRVCSDCGEIMNEGFVINGGDAYYCSIKCLRKNISKDEYLELFHDGDGDTYWTTF